MQDVYHYTLLILHCMLHYVSLYPFKEIPTGIVSLPNSIGSVITISIIFH